MIGIVSGERTIFARVTLSYAGRFMWPVRLPAKGD
jgi:hypothetical protein